MVHGQSTDEIDDFNAWLGSLPHKHKIVIAGNHDLLFEVRPTEARARITNAVYLEDSGVTLEGLNFWGSPVTPVFGDWAFVADRGAAIRRHWDKIPDDTDVLVTHGPPFGTLDKPDMLTPHLGCQELTKAVIRTMPRLHVFGHVHGGYGRESAWNNMLLVNCAVLNEAYALTNQPTVVDLIR
jgi:Icc-related predicted phosphoesterase